jgi:integral membrane sensor domain MASE1
MLQQSWAERGGPTAPLVMIGLTVVIGVAYYLAARLGLLLLTKPEGVAVFWPASGIAAGILIAFGPRMRGPVSVAVILASVAANLQGDRNLWSAIAFGFCNTGEALVTAWLLDRWFGPGFQLDSLDRVLRFLLAAAISAALAAVGATLAIRSFHNSAPCSLSGATGRRPRPSASSPSPPL